MKNRNGFTLVELIAVIAVLAVILLLVVPNILEMFEDGKKDAFIRQIQSVWKEAEKEFAVDYANDIDNSVYSDSVSNLGKQLKLNKSKVTYVVGFDDYGQVNYIAVGDSKFCYISANPDDMAISREAVSEGTLTCSAAGCTCAGESSTVPEGGGSTPVIAKKYKFWDYPIAYEFWEDYGSTTGAPRGIYPYSSYPSGALNSNSGLKGHMFMRTELSNTNEVAMQEVCISKPTSGYACLNMDMFSNSINLKQTLQDFFEDNFVIDESYEAACKGNGEGARCLLIRYIELDDVDELISKKTNSNNYSVAQLKAVQTIPSENQDYTPVNGLVAIAPSITLLSCEYYYWNDRPTLSCDSRDDIYDEELETYLDATCGIYGEEVGCYSMESEQMLP